jgi:alpha-tubulin suppressor-like RCC1 family protein
LDFVLGKTNAPKNLIGATAIETRWSDTIGSKGKGTVVVWGWNGFSQTNVPKDLSGVVAIAAGGTHTVALKNNGTVVV